MRIILFPVTCDRVQFRKLKSQVIKVASAEVYIDPTIRPDQSVVSEKPTAFRELMRSLSEACPHERKRINHGARCIILFDQA